MRIDMGLPDFGFGAQCLGVQVPTVVYRLSPHARQIRGIRRTSVGWADGDRSIARYLYLHDAVTFLDRFAILSALVIEENGVLTVVSSVWH